ncbi:hypothetical protein E2C01_004089 [Portunus trituberculatus]|uniref:Uncharacterized protein n=1 Tax=Portunus trituberculatus TaxID=210409 RepID=A0A5B7CVE4_PORTR|nr:hypothetical protein [Portunus trituberculatus]
MREFRGLGGSGEGRRWRVRGRSFGAALGEGGIVCQEGGVEGFGVTLVWWMERKAHLEGRLAFLPDLRGPFLSSSSCSSSFSFFTIGLAGPWQETHWK